MPTVPNIVLVMADQLTAFALSSYGNRVTRTPHIDAFARRATVFSNAYCTYPLCAPSRFAMMSGQLPSKIAAYDNAAEFPATVPTIAHYLRDAGYYTCLAGKMHFVGPDQHHGYEQRLTTEIYPSDFSWTPPLTYDELKNQQSRQSSGPAPGVSSVETITEAGALVRSMQMDYDDEVIHRACQHLFDRKRQSDQRPLFLTVSFTQPHDPYVSRREFWDLYSDDEIDPPRVAPITVDEMDEHSRSLYFHYSLDKFAVTDAVYRRARHGYYAMISDIDQKFGQLIKTLEECDMSDNTLIVLTSDHGDMLGERGLWFKKNLFDQSIRVPLMMAGPDGSLPPKVDHPVSLVDLLPTLLDAANIPETTLCTPIDGQSLFRCIDDRDADDRYICAEHLDGGTHAPRVMARRGDTKIVHSLDYPTQLYDLKTDPDERRNLAEHPDWQQTKATMLSRVNEIWNLKSLKQQVQDNQRTRQLLMRALSKGEKLHWEHYPNPHRSSTRWVREGDSFPEIEQRGYINYSD